MIWNSNVEIFCERTCTDMDCGKCNKGMARVTCVRCNKIIVYPIAQNRRPNYCKKCISHLIERYHKELPHTPIESLEKTLYVDIPKENPSTAQENTDSKAPRIDSVGGKCAGWHNPVYEE